MAEFGGQNCYRLIIGHNAVCASALCPFIFIFYSVPCVSYASQYFWTHFTHFALTHICTNRFFKWLNRWLTSPGPFPKRLSKSLIYFFPIRQNFFSLIITILTTFCVKLSEYISFLLLISTLASLVLIFLTRILFLSKLCLALRFCDFLTFAKKVRINSCKRYFLKLSLNLLFFHFIFCYLIFAFFINFSFIKLFLIIYGESIPKCFRFCMRFILFNIANSLFPHCTH